MAAPTACATCSEWSVWSGITWSICSGIPGQLAAEWGGQLHRNLQHIPKFNQMRSSLSKDGKLNQIDLQRDHQTKNESILEQLLKPEYSNGQLPCQWQMNQKPKKKKSGGLHL